MTTPVDPDKLLGVSKVLDITDEEMAKQLFQFAEYNDFEPSGISKSKPLYFSQNGGYVGGNLAVYNKVTKGQAFYDLGDDKEDGLFIYGSDSNRYLVPVPDPVSPYTALLIKRNTFTARFSHTPRTFVVYANFSIETGFFFDLPTAIPEYLSEIAQSVDMYLADYDKVVIIGNDPVHLSGFCVVLNLRTSDVPKRSDSIGGGSEWIEEKTSVFVEVAITKHFSYEHVMSLNKTSTLYDKKRDLRKSLIRQMVEQVLSTFFEFKRHGVRNSGIEYINASMLSDVIESGPDTTGPILVVQDIYLIALACAFETRAWAPRLVRSIDAVKSMCATIGAKEFITTSSGDIRLFSENHLYYGVLLGICQSKICPLFRTSILEGTPENSKYFTEFQRTEKRMIEANIYIDSIESILTPKPPKTISSISSHYGGKRTRQVAGQEKQVHNSSGKKKEYTLISNRWRKYPDEVWNLPTY
jgi:hypothetical protein